MPLPSVLAIVGFRVPRVVLNVTATPGSRLPFVSFTNAAISTVLPEGETVPGVELSVIACAPAAPTRMRTTFPADDDDVAFGAAGAGAAPGAAGAAGAVGVGVILVFVPGAAARPEIARTSAVPESLPATNIAVAMPFRVCASNGSIRPRLVVNRTVVPFGTGWPLFSSRIAVNSVVPPGGTTCDAAVSEILEPMGPSRLALSHPNEIAQIDTKTAHKMRASNQRARLEARVII